MLKVIINSLSIYFRNENNKRNENCFKKDPMKFLKQKNTVSEVKNLLNGYNSSFMLQKKRSVNLNRTERGQDSLFKSWCC